jgi:hypothetical protein
MGPTCFSQNEVDSLVARLYRFERERQRKIKKGMDQKLKDEMNGVTFTPLLISKQLQARYPQRSSRTNLMVSTKSLSQINQTRQTSHLETPQYPKTKQTPIRISVNEFLEGASNAEEY